MLRLDSFWDAVLATMAPVFVGYLGTRTQRYKQWRALRRAKREARDAVPGQIQEVVDGMNEIRALSAERDTKLERMNAKLDQHTATLAGQNLALADMTAVAYGQMMQDPQPRFVCDNAGSNRVVNTAFARLLRCGRDELGQFGYLRFIPEALNPSYMSGFASAAIQHRTYEAEVIYQRADGTMCWVQVLLVPHPEDNPPATHWNGFVRYLREHAL